jgi:hypothetical protein
MLDNGELCYNPPLLFRMKLRNICLQDLFSRGISAVGVLFVLAFASFAQQATPTPSPTPTPTPEAPISAAKIAAGDLTAEQVAELSVAVYGFPNGRVTLSQIRKSGDERGKITVTSADGKTQSATYQRWYIRPETGGEKIRLDQQFPSERFSLISANNEVFGVYNDLAFDPRADAKTAFENQLAHSLDAFLRYKENGSTVVYGGREKRMGVDYHMIDLTDKQGRKTRYFVSSKFFKVMMLEYESGGVTYRRKFHDYNYAQGTLVPYRSVLTSGDRTLEEIEVGTITYGQKVDDALFTKP